MNVIMHDTMTGGIVNGYEYIDGDHGDIIVKIAEIEDTMKDHL